MADDKPKISKKMIRLLFAVLLFLPNALPAQRMMEGPVGDDSGGPLLPEQAAYDVTFYDLSLAVDTDEQVIDGSLTAVVTIVDPIDNLVLDLDSTFAVDSVLVDGTGRQFEHDSGRVRIDLAEEMEAGTRLSATIFYGGAPRIAPRPPWVGGFTWSQTADGRPWVGVSCQMDGADIWWPVKDHPSDEPDSVGLHFRVDTSLVAAANGRLRGVEDHGDGTHTWHWFVSTPINNYTVTLNVAPYKEISGTYESVTGERIPYSFWVLPERLEEGRERYKQFKKELRFLEDRLGPYPFRADKYGVVHTPYLGMEHQTIIAYGSTFENNEWGFDGLHFHELAHEWWANLVTAADWKDFWIHESFASYMEALYVEELSGIEAYHEYVHEMRGRVLNVKPIAPSQASSTQYMYFIPERKSSNSDIYSKGAMVLHTLRYLVGDEMMMTILRRMAYPDPAMESVTDGRQTRLVDSKEFIALVESFTGEEVDWFFDLYIRQPELPELVVVRDAARLNMNWKTPNDLPFPMPVDVSVDGKIRRVQMVDGTVSLAVPEDATVEIDPLGWILKAE